MEIAKNIIPSSYIKPKNNTIKYLESKDGLESGILINKFYDLFVDGHYAFINPVPNFNPHEKEIFKTGKTLKDIYQYFGSKIDFRSLFISNKMLDILNLKSLSIAEHVCFRSIRYFNGIEIKNDLNWIYFYVDYYQYVDYSRTEYVIFDREKTIGNDLKIVDRILFNDKESVDKYEKNLQNTEFGLSCPTIYLQVPIEIDFFPLFEVGDRFYCTNKFIDIFNKNKLKGIEILDNRQPQVILL